MTVSNNSSQEEDDEPPGSEPPDNQILYIETIGKSLDLVELAWKLSKDTLESIISRELDLDVKPENIMELYPNNVEIDETYSNHDYSEDSELLVYEENGLPDLTSEIYRKMLELD